MSFGKKMLEKYGYKEGEGLGKHNNGITAPIKASFKFDNSGLGDKGPVKEDHWWERVFNEASTNINVNKSKEGTIGIDLTDKDGVEITNKSYSMKKLKNSNTTLQYGNFLKSATLLANKGEEKGIDGHVTTTDIEIKPFQAMSDEDLLKACEFRTAHKGARHGLKLSGKLQRIAEQERVLLEKMKTNRSDVFKSPTKKAKKRVLAELNSSKDESSDESELPINLEPVRVVSKKKQKKEKKELNVLADIMDAIELDKVSSQESVKKEETVVYQGTPVRKKKKQKAKDDLDRIVEEIEYPEETKPKKKNKKAKKRQFGDETEKKAENPKIIAKAKRIRLDESLDDSDNEPEKDIDEINEKHHMNLQNSKISKSDESKLKNLESSVKKKKKKGKSKAALLVDDNWKIKNIKKIQKYEHKKKKCQLKQEKLLIREGRVSKKAKKLLKKDEKKKFRESTDKVMADVGSADF